MSLKTQHLHYLYCTLIKQMLIIPSCDTSMQYFPRPTEIMVSLCAVLFSFFPSPALTCGSVLQGFTYFCRYSNKDFFSLHFSALISSSASFPLTALTVSRKRQDRGVFHSLAIIKTRMRHEVTQRGNSDLQNNDTPGQR